MNTMTVATEKKPALTLPKGTANVKTVEEPKRKSAQLTVQPVDTKPVAQAMETAPAVQTVKEEPAAQAVNAAPAVQAEEKDVAAEAKALLDAWQSAAMEESQAAVDHATQQAVDQLERALRDSEAQFKEQAESVAREERQAMDNASLYAALRGDRGGIGQEQYGSIQNTAAANRLAVQQMQTQLSTDTARQIEDLRAQGEFEKADQALKTTQSYLSELAALQQWAAEFGLTDEQFRAELEHWAAEHELAQQKADAAEEQWQQEFDYKKESDEQSKLAEIGKLLLSAGVDLSPEQLEALGLSNLQAIQYYMMIKELWGEAMPGIPEP